ncbi:MAG: dTDP-glucose 4,6-dehydratase [Clostridia bacterium]|nr:dTDP-glucose 4,6-dehydratase [Clostridia bacterium]
MLKGSDFKYKKLFVTGGAGFIGTNFINMLLDEGLCEVVCFDKLTYAANLLALEHNLSRKHFTFIKGDISSPSDVKTALEETVPDCIVNFAAETHVDRSIDSSAAFIRTNVLGTATLLDTARKILGDQVRFHQISTDEVYGDLPIDSEQSFTETSPLEPSNPYAASKASADLLVLSYVRTHGMNVTVSRCCNNYGAYQHAEKLIPHSVKQTLNGESIEIYGNGKNVREWIYAPDHCRAVLEILQNGRVGEIYNVGSGQLVSNIELAHRILSILNASPDRINFVPDRPGHDRKYHVNATKLSTELGFSPASDFIYTLTQTVKSYIPMS